MKALTNLVRLSILSAGTRPSGSPPTRLLFASSIAVAGRFPDLHPKGPYEVPETALEAVNSAKFGYPEAKWVCEALVVAAEELYGAGSSSPESSDPLIQGSNVRIGQMTGPEGSGAWNESEHFPIIVRTSQILKALPAVDGVRRFKNKKISLLERLTKKKNVSSHSLGFPSTVPAMSLPNFSSQKASSHSTIWRIPRVNRGVGFCTTLLRYWVDQLVACLSFLSGIGSIAFVRLERIQSATQLSKFLTSWKTIS